jgi:hypothetical protein
MDTKVSALVRFMRMKIGYCSKVTSRVVRCFAGVSTTKESEPSTTSIMSKRPSLGVDNGNTATYRSPLAMSSDAS